MIISFVLFASGASAETWVVSIKPKVDDNFQSASLRLWIGDAGPAKAVRGLLVLAPGWNGDGAWLVDDRRWQGFARELGFGIVGVTFKSDENTERVPPYHVVHLGSGNGFERGLRQLAVVSGHGEVADVPWLAWGHSAGGQFAYGLACHRPDRVLAFAAIKGGFYETRFDRRARGVPGLLVIGEFDEPFRAQNITRVFEEQRREGAVWCVAWERGADHGEGGSRDLVLPFFREVVALRLRSVDRQPQPVRDNVGWLGVRATYEVAPVGGLAPVASRVRTVWLPGEVSARAWAGLGDGVKGR